MGAICSTHGRDDKCHALAISYAACRFSHRRTVRKVMCPLSSNSNSMQQQPL